MLFPAAAAAPDISIANGNDTVTKPDVPSRWLTASNSRKTLRRVEIGSFPQSARSQIDVHGGYAQFAWDDNSIFERAVRRCFVAPNRL
jgi:hypothetical protein